MIEQAIVKVWDWRQSIEYDQEYMSDARSIVDQLDGSLKEVYVKMKDGSYQFATGNPGLWMSW
jgi:hypothetical protein